MAVDGDVGTDGEASDSGAAEAEPEQVFIYSQEVKCFLCGSTLGRLIGDPSLPRRARSFVAASGAGPTAPALAGSRCSRCGGPSYLDEVDVEVRLRKIALEKPKRGRKPKPRPERTG